MLNSWRVVMTRVKTSGPKEDIVRKINICPNAEESDKITACQRKSGCSIEKSIQG